MLKNIWNKIKKFFKDSETIFLARVQTLVGALGTIALWVYNDPTVSEAIKGALQPKYVVFYIVGLGLLTEYARRRRATDLN